MENCQGNIELAKAFLSRAQQDLKTGRLLRDEGQHPDACYHAQQCSEKAVKALLILEERFIKEHTVSGILQEVIQDLKLEKEEEKKLEKVVEYATALEEHWNIPRYPIIREEKLWDPLKGYSEQDAKEAVDQAEFVLDTLRSFLQDRYFKPQEEES